MDYPVNRTDAQWRESLSFETYQVLRLGATERPFTGELLSEDRPGTYQCNGCGSALFDSATKFNSHCGWPSYFAPADAAAIEYLEDRSHGMLRTEVRCANCGGHLGHLFEDAPQTPTGLRYCINSAALAFAPEESG